VLAAGVQLVALAALVATLPSDTAAPWLFPFGAPRMRVWKKLDVERGQPHEIYGKSFV